MLKDYIECGINATIIVWGLVVVGYGTAKYLNGKVKLPIIDQVIRKIPA